MFCIEAEAKILKISEKLINRKKILDISEKFISFILAH